MVVADLHATVTDRLRDEGQRYTANRRHVVEVLNATDRPLTIPEILGRRRDLPQSSAYRHIAVLERIGVVHRVLTSDEFARFELAEHLTEHHHHLIWSSCGGVSDFRVDAGVEETIGAAASAAADRTGFVTESHRLDLVGTCRRCA